MKTITLPMGNLYIYAYPAQMITFQLVIADKIYSNENCAYEDVIKTVSKYLEENLISNMFIVGETAFADRIETIVKNTFSYKVNNIERIKNA